MESLVSCAWPPANDLLPIPVFMSGSAGLWLAVEMAKKDKRKSKRVASVKQAVRAGIYCVVHLS